ncbi:MAG TPA: MFS transporter [Candidatus Paceibacterota bacterium]|nr:MFS transporter [Verrucomicrobiota bacterium]HOX03773.1 MFS transporter [Verrucomicrobiota bacterium]HRZ46687.1 MFS transporter [Candidatus Paceibacterota bacterium]HRZ93565.1 MFS transporter [Candidatus Paceibacterota bacterium]
MSSAAPGTPAVPRIAWILCGLLFGATALSFLDRQVLSVLAPSLTEDLGMSNTQYARVVSAFVFAYTVMFAAGGWLVDRLGTVRGLALAVAVWSLASAGHALAAGALGLGVARFVLGLGEGACFPGATKGAVEWFPPHKRNLAIGIAIGGSAFGAVLAPPVTAWLAVRLGWRGAFVATGAIGAVWVAAWLAAGRFAPDSGAGREPERSSAKPAWGEIFRHPAAWRLLLARFCFDPVFYFYMFWIPQYLSRERGFSLEEIGRYYWIPFLALGLSNIASGRLGDLLLQRGWSARGVRRTLLGAAAFLTPVSCLVIIAPGAGWAIALMAVLMVAHGLWICNYVALISDHFPSRVMATVFGLTGTVGGAAGILANMATGPVVDGHGFAPIFIGTSFLYPLALVVLLTIPRAAAALERRP